ncbi:phosphoenolpyruvate--protein phosphotransferase [Treponema phagedenis]|uniref:phosphoenolpyruvate--protein phosphotransferase n=1 Tax=Treponema phagedenis TaxID=162 RepID=UPI0011E6B88B|nr:phosphoenolpyruvate--protein phosphotransferase [Treponema phagedenis]QEK01433.1 phosphoenolpyruvate--protein phosphotransferase [Treponema phagedenis]QEK06453.1 phosphoenolpyruvate--protein phosphotransferase [Treponema phagedenis]
MKKFQGLASAAGFALAKAVVLETNHFSGNRVSINESQFQHEIESLHVALKKTIAEIERLKDKAAADGFEEQSEIFAAYIEIVDDEELRSDVETCIKEKSVDLSTALMDVCNEYAADMAALDDPYMQARADDFRQIFRIIMDMHTGAQSGNIGEAADFILVATEVGPADMAKADKKYLKGIVVETGSRTSHAAIVCRSMGLPMLSGINYTEAGIQTGDLLIVDAVEGNLFVNPDSALKAEYAEKISKAEAEKKCMESFRDKKGVTGAGTPIMLMANIGTVEEIDAVLENNAEGIGLFRTEFLFMQNPEKLPTEEEQFKAYKTVLSKMGDRPVTFRTLDAGGDKHIAALGIPKEENPFLGWRAIRYCLKTPEIFRVQLRALLRASEYGNCKIMIPMITGEKELLQTKKLVESVYQELEERDGKKIKPVPLGIMIETPAAALTAETLAQHVDFFSIGTNDLTQYTIAVDRGNEYVSELYDEMHPAVLSLIRQTVHAALKAGIEIHMCGEMASLTECTEAILQTGLRELSMSPNRIPYLKEHLLTLKI